MDLTNSTEEIDQLDVETAEDQTAELVNDDVAVGEPRLSNESANSTASSSSSSKRKSFQPQKNIEDVEHPDEEDDDENPSQDINTNDDGLVKSEDKPETENSRQFEGLSALQSQLNQPNMKFQEMFETQRKLYNNIIEQQKKFFPPQPPPQQPPAEIMPDKVRPRDFTQLAQTLKTEIIDSLSGSIDKVCDINNV
ncbi:hypothetical protein GCK32_016082 [Trichostrongylus colubriformis]|uniref:Uncharacterized protein n=1 Tax=Trichostrongylus colubriformis TaxID=6319 RepID=A0AAN8G4N8_TRICO